MKLVKGKRINCLLHPRFYLPGIILIFLFLLPSVIHGSFYKDLLIMVFLWAALAGAWNLIGGFTGQIALGHTVFFGLGAYTSTLLYLNFGVSPWLGMLAGAGIAVIAGIVVGYPCFRLKTHFFALATIALGEVMFLIATYWRGLTRGSVGLLIPFKPGMANFMFANKTIYAYIALSFMVVVTFTSYLIKRSKFGFYLIALREDQEAAESLGVNTSRCKLIALLVSAFFTAIGGSFYAQYNLFVEPESVFSLTFSIELALISIIGGIGTVLGPVVGSAVLVPLDVFLRGWLGQISAGLNFVVYGIILIIAINYFHDGIMGWLGRKYDLIVTKLPSSKVFLRERVSLSSQTKTVAHDPAENEYTILEVKGLTRYFGGLAAVKNVDFQIQRGEIVGLIGPNGAGKTTIFNLLSGFLSPNSGEVNFKGKRIAGIKPPHKICMKGIGRTFQLTQPFNNMTVLENVMVGAFSRTEKRAEAEQKAREVLNFVGLDKYQESLAANLTIADRKRLELARALATDPEFLLLDEVMAGLNPKETDEIIHIIKKISQQGITLLIIEHVMQAIMNLCDRIIVLDHGTKIAEGTPTEVSKDKKVIDAYLGEELKERKEQVTGASVVRRQQTRAEIGDVLLKLDSVSTSYGDLQALYNICLEVKEREIVSIVGSNGAGKTTLLNTISGILPSSSGAIEFGGEKINNMSSHHIVEMGLIQVPEGRLLFPYMTVLENLRLGAHVRRARENEDVTLEKIFDLFPILKERKNQRAGTLSGGEQQMLAIARGMMARPKLLMLDEPSLGLAPKLVKQVFQVVEQINQEGVTVLLVEQNVFHSLSIADRGYVLENGRIVLKGTGEELLNNEHVRKAYLGI